jgi:hypothetical protein
MDLVFYWSDVNPSERYKRSRGQLALAMRRMAFVREELESVLDAKDIGEMLERLQYHAENYLDRAYELVKRAEAFDTLRKRSLQTVPTKATSANFTEALERVRNITDADIKLRNSHTHEAFLSLGIWTGKTVFDVQDLLVEFEDGAESTLRKAAELFVAQYVQKCTDITEATMSLLTSTKEL